MGRTTKERISTEELKARIDEGARYLDVIKPGWVDEIDLTKLDMSFASIGFESDCGCIAAQLSEDGNGFEFMFHNNMTYAESSILGLWFADGEVADYVKLTKLWKEEILRRRGQAAAS